jgi:Zn-dependent protease with chaperone function
MKGRLDEVCERAVARVGGRAPRLGVVGGEQTCALTPLSSWGRGLVLVGLDDFEGLCDGELEAVLVHEIGHVRARDGWRDEALFGGHLAVYIVAGVGAAAGVIGPVVLAGVALGCWTSHFVTQRALSRRREAAADRFAARAGVGVALAGALWARGREDGVPGADGKGLTRWFARLRMSHPLASERRSYLVRSGVNWPETDPASG